MLTLADIARAVNGKVVGRSVRAPSPGHSPDDNGMSIKLAPGAPDGFVVHLFNGSEAEALAVKNDIRDRLGMPSFEPKAKMMNGRVEETIRRIKARSKAKSKPEPEPEIVATYDYVTADGVLAYQVVREEPKGFKQRRPRSGGGWIWNRGDVPPVLYRLPELLKYESATVFFTEGEADADRLARLDLVATTVSGDAADKWTPELAEPLRERDVIVLQDNDTKGAERATAAAQALHGLAKSVRVVLLPGLPPRGDVSDWLDAGHSQAELESICVAAPLWRSESAAADEPAPRFTFTEFGKITWSAEVEHLIYGILPRSGLVVIYGEPKCGKSFWCFDLVMHPARGIDYRGRDVVAGTVVYLAAEGGTGFKKRVEAYRRQHDCNAARFYLCTDRPDLGTDAPAIIADIKHMIGDSRPDIVVIDTLNRTLVGSENKPEDMARYLRAAATIEDTFSCCVIVVHHCGVEKGRPRGHTSLTAAADVQIVVERSGAGDVIVTIELAKDAPSGDEIISRLDVVELGDDERGNRITTCVIVEGDEGLRPRKQPNPLPDQLERAKRALANMICDHGEENANMPVGFRGVTEETWREECYRLGIGGPKEGSMRKAFGRSKDRLTRLEIVGTSRGWYWVARP
ncbi:AAA family ATPase [Bradyrhizobium sp. SZCCHNRI1002]|uniref:AAA family ATPase n=1 Tax=Bradyrhizobium sp. SZCCHNRI1002 TaxID=3057274 RepID=UPI0028E45458|nr:AAA family ATPase [Bradyrhizobium sp. SZCCHNRI1002]